MTKRIFILSISVAVGSLLLCSGPASAQDIFREGTPIELPAERAALAWADVNGDGLVDLIVARDRELTIRYQNPETGYSDSGKSIQRLVPGLGGGLLDFSDLDGDGTPELILLHRSGVSYFRWDDRTERLVPGDAPLLADMRGPAFLHLQRVDFMRDVDNDGDDDLLYPVDGKYYLYFREGDRFTMKNRIATAPISFRVGLENVQFHESIRTSLSIPRLRFVDLDGDGRLDLRVRDDDRIAFYIQSASGVLPETPSHELDLARFKPKTPRKNNNPMRGERFQFIPMDLNADGREDYTIVSENKIWVFKSSKGKIDFSRPDQLLKVSAEQMSALLLPINEDDKPDLVLLKYRIPSMGRIVAGLAVGFKFEVEVLGYDNTGEGTFSRRPDRRATLVFKVPPILKLLGEIESIQKDFEEIGRQARRVAVGDFNGDGAGDVAKLGEHAMDLYLSKPGAGEGAGGLEQFLDESGFLRDILFGERRREVTLDTILGILSDFFGSAREAAIAGRDPSVSLPLGLGDASIACEHILCTDLNGDGRDDIILFIDPDEQAPDTGDGAEATSEAAADPELDEDVQRVRYWISVPQS